MACMSGLTKNGFTRHCCWLSLVYIFFFFFNHTWLCIINFFDQNGLVTISYFLIKTCILGTNWNHLSKALLMSTHNICFD